AQNESRLERCWFLVARIPAALPQATYEQRLWRYGRPATVTVSAVANATIFLSTSADRIKPAERCYPLGSARVSRVGFGVSPKQAFIRRPQRWIRLQSPRWRDAIATRE